MGSPTGGVRRKGEADLVGLIRRGGEDGVRAAVLVCEGAEPASFTALLRLVYPKKVVKGAGFDALADGYNFWAQAAEIEALPSNA